MLDLLWIVIFISVFVVPISVVIYFDLQAKDYFNNID